MCFSRRTINIVKMQDVRNKGIDLVKTVAVLFVISVHFFLNNGFYTTEMFGKEMFISTFFRWSFYICVPLFIITTGFLMRNKVLSSNYYKSLLKTLITYVLISIICLTVRIYYLQDDLTWLDGIKGMLNFTTPYSWYVNMYVGLYLLIPFLNILYKNIKKKEEKILLIVTLLFLTGLSTTFLIRKLLPNWWYGIYPITYYFVGAYLFDYKVDIRKWKLIVITLFILLIQTIISYFFSRGEVFKEYNLGYGNFLTAMVAICVFLLLFDVEIKNRIFISLLTTISKLTLEIYLISYIVDRIVYLYLKKYFYSSIEMLPYMLLIVLFVFIISLISSIGLSIIQKKIFMWLHIDKYNIAIDKIFTRNKTTN